ncbi:VanW family protein [Serratia sp. 14-2641]|uniref:VanW family protein n=1 Tax=Serratia sp. 14-2641 TaxID=1841657 RepID=UPI000945A7EA|nr:VanW family protein [Serratia sp. 14-2641]
MEIHSPLVVAERANHSFDPFPDEGRILPFGSGAAIFYNYIDLVLHNPAQGSVQLVFNVAERQFPPKGRTRWCYILNGYTRTMWW